MDQTINIISFTPIYVKESDTIAEEQNSIFPCKMNRLDMNRFNKHLLAEAFLMPILLPIMLNAMEMSYVPQHLVEDFPSTVNGLHP